MQFTLIPEYEWILLQNKENIFTTIFTCEFFLYGFWGMWGDAQCGFVKMIKRINDRAQFWLCVLECVKSPESLCSLCGNHLQQYVCQPFASIIGLVSRKLYEFRVYWCMLYVHGGTQNEGMSTLTTFFPLSKCIGKNPINNGCNDNSCGNT